MKTIKSKNIPNVKDKFIGKNYKLTLEEGNENYIKREFGEDE